MDIFVIEHVQSGLVIDAAQLRPNGKAVLFERQGGDNQRWELRDAMIISKVDGSNDRFVLEVNKDTGKVQIGERDDNNPYQKWFFEEDGTLRSGVSGLVLDFVGNAEKDTEMRVQGKHFCEKQQFRKTAEYE